MRCPRCGAEFTEEEAQKYRCARVPDHLVQPPKQIPPRERVLAEGDYVGWNTWVGDLYGLTADRHWELGDVETAEFFREKEDRARRCALDWARRH